MKIDPKTGKMEPFAYGLRSLAQNEFFSPRYDDIVPSAYESVFNATTGATDMVPSAYERLGDTFLDAFGMSTARAWQWGG